ncbi:MAG: tRNA-binding protein [Candidatus Micrarchaeota archaeon]|nr:tRNA-binding protein [Candidatus Micrarchaeota archaeon]
MVTISDFASMGLRVGRIIEVEDLEGSRKPMYKLKVDLGELGTRNLVAGLKGYYSREELLNTDIIVVTNLEPKRIANFVSEGMLLAADDGTNVVLVRPEKEISPGSTIR